MCTTADFSLSIYIYLQFLLKKQYFTECINVINLHLLGCTALKGLKMCFYLLCMYVLYVCVFTHKVVYAALLASLPDKRSSGKPMKA